MAKKEEVKIQCFRKFRAAPVPKGEEAPQKVYIKIYEDHEEAKKDQNKRLEQEIFEFREA